MKFVKHLLFVIVVSTLCLGLSAAASAHFLWLNLSDYTPRESARIKLYIGYGHRFPLDDFFETKGVAEVKIYDPSGKTLVAPALNDFMFQSEPLTQPGVYLAVTERQPLFFTKLEKGFARAPKTGLKGVKNCSQILSFLKAIAVVGEGQQGDVSRRTGQALELVPLDNPGKLKPGDFMRIQVLFKGEPAKGSLVYATYAGFSDLGAFAYTSHADKNGVFTLRILQPGPWLVQVKHEEPYPKPEECDVIKYSSNLTFLIP